MSSVGKTFYEQVQKLDDENRIEKIYTSNHLNNRMESQDRGHMLSEIGWFDGKYHVFIRNEETASRDSVVRLCSYYTSIDLINWKYEGIALCPDTWGAMEGHISHLRLKHKRIGKFYRTAERAV
ncbi:MAG: hypothetical protein Q4E89_12810 [Eubacteriales bacterium]|nr:hypothetical protein [Eubacteriales bacterium]